MSDVEDRLSRYRPAGPPANLRGSVLRAAASSPRSSRLREWLPAIAAAALIVLFSALNYHIHVSLETRLAVPDDLKPVEQWLPDDPRGPR
jgi:hypothetical protein